MNYNYSQAQFQQPQNFSGYRAVPQYPQWPQPASSLGQVRPVSSIEEVKACPIDFDGSIFYFTDVANKRIYTKQINLDGTVSIFLYEQKDLSAPEQQQPMGIIDPQLYVTKQEFETSIKQLREIYEQLTETLQNINTASNPLNITQEQATQFQF